MNTMPKGRPTKEYREQAAQNPLERGPKPKTA
jgi:hypothetical protein